MTQQPTPPEPSVPEWDLADRMRKALRTASISVKDMADYLEVSRNTVSSWINGRITPSGQTLRLWSLRCGVPLEWLRTGQVTPPEPSHPRPDGPEGGGSARSDPN